MKYFIKYYFITVLFNFFKNILDVYLHVLRITLYLRIYVCINTCLTLINTFYD